MIRLRLVALSLVSLIVLSVLSVVDPPHLARAQGEDLRERYVKWFYTDYPRDLDIKIDTNKDPKLVKPPRVKLKANNSLGRPELHFQLAKVIFGDHLEYKKLIFKAYTDPDDKNTAQKNLYLVVFHTDTSDIHNYIGYFDGELSGARYIPRLSKIHDDQRVVRESSYINLLTYLVNAPIDRSSNSCSGLAETALYRSGPEYKPKNIVSRNDSDIFRLDDNCLNTDPDGWIAHWNANLGGSNGQGSRDEIIADSANPSNDVCTFGWLSTIFDIAGSISRAIVCFAVSLTIGAFEIATRVLGAAATFTGGIAGYFDGRPGIQDDNYLRAWIVMRNIINLLVVMALIAIAFANILHLNLNTYAVKKALPNLIIGVIGANASILLIRFLIDLAVALNQLGVDIATADPNLSRCSNVAMLISGCLFRAITSPVLEYISNSNAILALVSAPAAAVFIIVIAIFVVFLVFIFAWTLFLRLLYVIVLTIVAPLAFVSYGIPPLSQWFSKWWDTLIRQLFFFPVAVIAIGLLVRLANAIQSDVGDVSLVTIAGASISGVNTTAILNAFIIWGATIMILKLPGSITKGTIDITNAAQKAFGHARSAPQAGMYMGNQAMERWKKRPEGSFRRVFADTLTSRFGTRSGIGKSLYGAATLISKPQTYTKAFQQRLQVTDKALEREASTLQTGTVLGHVHDFSIRPLTRIPKIGPRIGQVVEPFMETPLTGYLAGREGAFDDAIKKNLERINSLNIHSEGALKNFLYTGNLAESNMAVSTAINKYLATMTPGDQESFIFRLSRASSGKELVSIYDELQSITDPGVRLNYESLARVAAATNRASYLARRPPPRNYSEKIKELFNPAAEGGGSPYGSPKTEHTPPPYSTTPPPEVLPSEKIKELFNPAAEGGGSPYGSPETEHTPPPYSTTPPPEVLPGEGETPTTSNPAAYEHIKAINQFAVGLDLTKLQEALTKTNQELAQYLAEHLGQRLDHLSDILDRPRLDNKGYDHLAAQIGEELRGAMKDPRIGLKGAMSSLGEKLLHAMTTYQPPEITLEPEIQVVGPTQGSNPTATSQSLAGSSSTLPPPVTPPSSTSESYDVRVEPPTANPPPGGQPPNIS